MTSYETFSLTLCIVVFALLAAVCGLMLYYVVMSRLRLIHYGDYDGEIIKEYKEGLEQKDKKYRIFSYVLNTAISALLTVSVAFAVFVNLREDSFLESMPTLRVVLSDSMSKKLQGNDYLFENDLNDQFHTYDIILTYKAPAENELKLYDIVVYEVDEQLVVHRIVDIEAPNERHPEHRYFTLQGDAVGNIDRFPVLYSQIKGIYRGQRIPFLGGVVKFLQSPAGWLCLILILAATLLSPKVDKRIDKQKRLRLIALGYIEEPTAPIAEETGKVMPEGAEPMPESLDKSLTSKPDQAAVKREPRAKKYKKGVPVKSGKGKRSKAKRRSKHKRSRSRK